MVIPYLVGWKVILALSTVYHLGEMARLLLVVVSFVIHMDDYNLPSQLTTRLSAYGMLKGWSAFKFYEILLESGARSLV